MDVCLAAFGRSCRSWSMCLDGHRAAAAVQDKIFEKWLYGLRAPGQRPARRRRPGCVAVLQEKLLRQNRWAIYQQPDCATSSAESKSSLWELKKMQHCEPAHRSSLPANHLQLPQLTRDSIGRDILSLRRDEMDRCVEVERYMNAPGIVRRDSVYL